jgi:hypothetical protein
MFPDGPDFSSTNEDRFFSQAGQAFSRGFIQGSSTAVKTAFENSGVGLFINTIIPTGQSDFSQYENLESGLIHFCDKAGEICGAWTVLQMRQ